MVKPWLSHGVQLFETSHPVHHGWAATVDLLYQSSPAISQEPLPPAKCEGPCSKRHLKIHRSFLATAQSELVNWENPFTRSLESLQIRNTHWKYWNQQVVDFNHHLNIPSSTNLPPVFVHDHNRTEPQLSSTFTRTSCGPNVQVWTTWRNSSA